MCSVYSFFCQYVSDFLNLSCSFSLRHSVTQFFCNFFSYIFNADDKRCKQICFNLFTVILCPESIVQVIVCRGRCFSDCFVTTVVVGQNQSVFGNNFTCTVSVERDDSIFQRRIVDRIDLICSQIQTMFLHVFIISSQ